MGAPGHYLTFRDAPEKRDIGIERISLQLTPSRCGDHHGVGFNRRKMEGISVGRSSRKRPPPAARPMPECLKMPSA
jgi:hypothetical protein